jgi:hypothetical protein
MNELSIKILHITLVLSNSYLIYNNIDIFINLKLRTI